MQEECKDVEMKKKITRIGAIIQKLELKTSEASPTFSDTAPFEWPPFVDERRCVASCS